MLAWFPDGWGWNLATIQVIGTLGVFGSLALALWAIVQSRQEVSLRMRPWIGITGVDYVPPEGTGLLVEETVSVHYHNIGPLPARSLTIELHARPVVPPGALGAHTNANAFLDFDSMQFGVLFPGEDSVQHFRLRGSQSGRLMGWLRAGHDVHLTGSITYGFGAKKTWRTNFDARITFAPAGVESWANQSDSQR